MIFQLDSDFLTTMGQIGSVATAVATVALVFLFLKTIMQLEETVKVSKIESNYRFRPWIGPISSIDHMATTSDGREQFYIIIKNYGELPSQSVTAKFIAKPELLKKEMLNSDGVSSFNLGPLLPNMEKRYWFFIDSDLIEKTKNDSGQVFTLLYFQYQHRAGTSGYGIISKFEGRKNSFVHTDMWLD